jgi:hypothetical protein
MQQVGNYFGKDVLDLIDSVQKRALKKEPVFLHQEELIFSGVVFGG